MKVLAFAASSSHKSINRELVSYASELMESGLVEEANVEVIDINDYEMPIYSVDRENLNGIPAQAEQFYRKISNADALVVSFAEHNGYYTSAYKNLFDWTSRVGKQVYQNKPSVILATSPGSNGGRNVLKMAKESAPFFGMDVKADLSVPRFYENFDVDQKKVKNGELQERLETALAKLN